MGVSPKIGRLTNYGGDLTDMRLYEGLDGV